MHPLGEDEVSRTVPTERKRRVWNGSDGIQPVQIFRSWKRRIGTEHVSYGVEVRRLKEEQWKWVRWTPASTTSPHSSYLFRLEGETSHSVNAEGSPPQPHELYEPGSRIRNRLWAKLYRFWLQSYKKLTFTAALTGPIFPASPILRSVDLSTQQSVGPHEVLCGCRSFTLCYLDRPIIDSQSDLDEV